MEIYFGRVKAYETFPEFVIGLFDLVIPNVERNLRIVLFKAYTT